MDLSPEMISYTATGRCPYCHMVILSPAYMSEHGEQLQSFAGRYLTMMERLEKTSSSDAKLGFFGGLNLVGDMAAYFVGEERLAPADADAKVSKDGDLMQCLTCKKSWTIGTHPIASDSEGSSTLKQPSAPPVAPKAAPPVAPKNVDLSGCKLFSVTGEKQVEEFIGETRKQYQNNSKTTVTREISITNSVTLTVTTDSSQLASYTAGAGVTIHGFASIQGQVQRQLSERYSVTLRCTLGISEKSSVAIPPYSTIEHVIRWKVVSLVGAALLGKPAEAHSQPLAQIPYKVPLRLTYDDDFVDVRGKRKHRWKG